ncbi:MAG: polysaccharide deacetylase family protein [Thaumarchaeota archaeon]|nr:polysaccharide deacetylase family protein [Nitrososphaerota archaeon]
MIVFVFIPSYDISNALCKILVRLKIILALIFLISFGVAHEAYGIQACQCVAFRMDDIQDYWLDTVQVGVISEFEHKDADLTVGIIGNYFGQDQSIVDTVSSALKEANPKVVVANHGWNHEHFNTFPQDEQSALIHNTNQKILDTLGILPNIFIAPYNAINNDTLISLFENKMVYLSTNETQDRPPYRLTGAAFFIFPGTAEIGDINKANTAWVSVNHNETYAEVLRSLVKYGFAVVVLHPQDFANKHSGFVYDNTINQTQIHELDLLLDDIRNAGYKTVTMDDIPANSNFTTKYPSWLDKNFEMYIQGNTSDADMTNSINYLKNEHVILSSGVHDKYSLHQNVTTTYFWVGEPADADNQYNDNLSSAWDSAWVNHYGGVDDPKNRDQYLPSGFTPKENPFYFALPYDDFSENGTRKASSYGTVYWSGTQSWNDSVSMVKNRWIEISKGDKTVYAQWEDSGPFVYDDSGYVFGSAKPSNQQNNNAGLDVSPAVKDYIGLQHGKNLVSWRFVDYSDVPDGPWKQIVTTSEVYHPHG